MMPPKDRYASGSGPVNRRTVRQPVAVEAPVPHPSVRQRLARVQAQHRLGGLLSQRLAVGRHSLQGDGPGRSGRGVAGIAVAVGGTLSAVGVLIAWLQQSAVVGVVASVGACAAAGAGWWLMRQRRGRSTAAPDLPELFDLPALGQLDEVLRELASEVSEAHLLQLRRLADTLERMAPLMRQTGVNEHFTQDDRFYVTECVRRYWPDTLQAYLRVPRIGRSTLGAEGGPSADGLLSAQLTLLQQELSQREQGLMRASAAGLEQQQRFLHAKGTQGPLR